MGHSCTPGQAWDVCKQQGGEAASRALTQVQVAQAKREEQGRHCHLERGVRGRPPPGRGVGSGAPHTLLLLWGLLFRLVFGMLYPTYASYKAVKTKNIREYVRWMMYWIVFALFMAVETFTDVFISWYGHWGSEIDTYIVQAKERSYETVLSFGKRGLNIAASAAVQAATKSQGALAGRLRSFSMQDLRTISDAPAPTYQDPLYLEDQVPHRRPPIGYRSGGLQDSDTEDECWSDTEVVPQPSARPREKPLGRTQSLRVVKRKPPVREGTTRSLKVRTRKKTTPSDMDS
ncbi:hypothetical protein DBR06_SOUSAS4410024 [Sousa chinensis]|nr:hypothetical protein DBR06_SOUSAS4410024 [Sousa chinensis]